MCKIHKNSVLLFNLARTNQNCLHISSFLFIDTQIHRSHSKLVSDVSCAFCVWVHCISTQILFGTNRKQNANSENVWCLSFPFCYYCSVIAIPLTLCVLEMNEKRMSKKCSKIWMRWSMNMLSMEMHATSFVQIYDRFECYHEIIS